MFTGIIEAVGTILKCSKGRKFSSVSISCDIAGGVGEGDSVSVNGVCLTASGFGRNSFSVDVSPETLKKTNIGKLCAGDKVNLERAVTPSTRLGGHFVSGHVDGTGRMSKSERVGEGYLLTINAKSDILGYIVQNGSVAVDGISLTVVAVTDKAFQLMIIPHTSLKTTLIAKKEGDSVNIECDIIGKYVEKFIKKDNCKGNINKKGVTSGFLAEHGF